MKALVSMRGRAGPRFSPAFRVAAHGWSAAIPAGTSTAIDMILGAGTNYRSASIRFWIDKALAEMARVLRPGSYLILCDIAHRDSYVLRLQQLGSRRRELRQFPAVYYFCTRAGLILSGAMLHRPAVTGAQLRPLRQTTALSMASRMKSSLFPTSSARNRKTR